MHSSSESASPTGARTPTETSTRLNAGSELSPPGSQTASQYEDTGPSVESLAAGGLETAAERRGSKDGKSQSTQLNDQPGASWMNQRAQEEYNRALEAVIDKDFSLRELESFGCRCLEGPNYRPQESLEIHTMRGT